MTTKNFVVKNGITTGDITLNAGTGNITGTNLSVTGVSSLGAVGNVVITGGTANYVLSTDGSGNLSWVAGGGTAANVTVDNFTGNGIQTIFTLSTTPIGINQTSVNYNGATVLRTDYTLANANITFSSAPANGSYIEVTTINLSGGGGGGSANIAIYDEGNLLTNTVSSLDFVGSGVIATNTGNAVTVTITSGSNAQPSFTTRTYTGNGVQNTFTVTNGVTSTGILVTENGILQTPGTDYNVSNANLIFTTAPANLQAIQIRELGTVVAANTASSARALGYSLIFGG